LARRMVDWSKRVDETMDSLHGQVYGHLNVGCSTTAGKYILPYLLTSFMQEHTHITANCVVSPRRQAVEDLCDGLVHLALASPRDFCHMVEFCRFITDPIQLITPRDPPWASRQQIDAEELLGADFIMREVGSGTYDVTARGLAEVGIGVEQLHTVLTLGNSEAIALAVEEGLGVGFVSRIVVTRLVCERVACVDIRGVSMNQDVYVGRNLGLAGTTAQNAFWHFLTNPSQTIRRHLASSGFELVLDED
jgi:DNA-binding transcriptional LysR family regulator